MRGATLPLCVIFLTFEMCLGTGYLHLPAKPFSCLTISYLTYLDQINY